MSTRMVTIPQSEYNRLRRNSIVLSNLEAAGVDNWCGWDEAMEMAQVDLDEFDNTVESDEQHDNGFAD